MAHAVHARAAGAEIVIDIFGLGKAASTAIIVVGLGIIAGGAYLIWEDRVGDKREAEIERKALEKRLENVRDSNERKVLLERLPRFAKIWCSVDNPDRTCCAPDAVKLPKCTHDPASAAPRPN